MNYNANITLTKEEHERLQAYLVDPQSEDEALEEGDNFTVTAKFDNGYEMDIYIYPVAYDEENDDNLPWTEATLYDPEGKAVANTECRESTDFIGKWELSDNDGNTYTIDVNDYDREREKTSSKKDNVERD